MTKKTEKERFYRGRILGSLLRHDMVTVSMLAEEAGIAENSVRAKLGNVEEYLAENQLGTLTRKPHVGIWLEATDSQREALRQEVKEATSNQEFISDQNLRRDEVLRLIFQMRKSQPLTLNAIGQKLYLSPPAAKKSFQLAAAWLEKNGIQVQAVQNRGITLETSESNYRNVLKNHLLQNYFDGTIKSVEEFLPAVLMEEVRQCLVNAENIWRLEFSDYSFRDIWLYLVIAVYRMNTGHAIEPLSKEEEVEIAKHKEFEFSSNLVDMLAKKKGIRFPAEEVLNLAKLILCTGMACGSPQDPRAANDVFEYDSKLKAFTKDVIATMSVVLGEDLTEDVQLYEGLLQHLRPAVFRLRYGYEKVDELLDYTRQEYKNVFRAAWSTSTLFESYFNVNVTADELLYITLYVEVALERKKRSLRGILVVQANDIHAQLTAMKIQKAFPRIVKLEPVSVQNFVPELLKENDFALVTEDSAVQRAVAGIGQDERLILVPKVFSDDAELKLKQDLRDLTANRDRQDEKLAISSIPLLDPDLMFIHCPLTSKEEILRTMVDKLVKEGYVMPGYFDSVMTREKATTTAIGNGVAIPHGFPGGVNQSKVCICTLQQPINWNGEMVDVIFLLAIKTNTVTETDNVRQFYKYFVKLTDTKEKVDVIRNIPTSSEMYKYLIS